MCDQAVKEDPYSLQFLPDWFVTREGVDMWCGMMTIIMMMMMIGIMMTMMKMNFLGGTVAIKNARLKKQK